MSLLRNVWGNTPAKHYISVKPVNGAWRDIPVFSVEEAEQVAAKYSDTADLYFGCSTFNKDGTRKQIDVTTVQSYWVDIDCGAGKPYPNKKAAVTALNEFCETLEIPFPTIVDSGNGLHCHWPLNQRLPREVWRPIADKFKVFTHRHGFKVDDARTADEASVMRMPDTMNRKDPTNPKKISLIRNTGVFNSDEFVSKIESAYADGKGELKNHCTVSNDDTVAKLVNHMAAKEARLHAGEWQRYETALGGGGHNSQSEADYAYLGECVRKLVALGTARDKIASIALEAFKQSGLYRDDRKALLAINKHVDTLPARDAITEKRNRVQLDLSDGLIELSDIPPPPREFVIEGLLPAGKSALFAGSGGTSKTQGALQFMVGIAAGKSILSREVMHGAALGIFAEDDPEELARRINAIINTFSLSQQQRKSVANRLRALSMIGLDARFTKPINGAIESTGFVDEIIRLAEELAVESCEPVRLIVIDHASLIHGGDFNSREDVAQTGRLVNHIANVTGAAVLLLAHTRKGSSTKDDDPSADDAAGSTAWVDLVRSVMLLRTMTEKEGRVLGVAPDKRKEFASLNVVKANYAPPSNAIWLHRRGVEGWGVGVLTEVDLKPKAKPMPGRDWRLGERIADLVKSNQNLTQTKIQRYCGKDGGLGASKHKVDAEIDRMLADGVLVLAEPTVEEKKLFGIRGATSGFLRIGEKQS